MQKKYVRGSMARMTNGIVHESNSIARMKSTKHVRVTLLVRITGGGHLNLIHPT